jgi:hypothetical protein
MPSKMGSGAQVLTSGTNVPFGLMKTRIPIFTRALFHFEQGQGAQAAARKAR